MQPACLADFEVFRAATPRFTAVLLTFLLVVQGFEPLLFAQATPLTQQALDQLLSPVALYPDSLLSQIMTASTNPQEILDVDNWLSQNSGLTGEALTTRRSSRDSILHSSRW